MSRVLQLRICTAPIKFTGIVASIIISLGGTAGYSQEKGPDTEERIRKLEEAVKKLQDENEQLRQKKASESRPSTEVAPVEKAKLWGDHDVRFFWKEGLNFQSGDGKTFKGKLGGRLQYDVAGFEESDAVKAVAGDQVTSTEFRRARLYTSGEINQGIPVNYILQMEFAGGDVRFADAYLGVSKIPYVGLLQIGQFYEPFSLEQNTSDNYVTFMERAAPIETFSPARNVGLMELNTLFDERMTYALSVFADDDADDADAVPIESNIRFTGRVTGLPWYDEESGGQRYLHLGMGGSIINPKNDTVRFRTRPEAHLAPRYVDTGAFAADMAYLANLEAILTLGSLSLQGEYFQNWNDSQAASDPTFNGFYVFVSYFLTGEYRPYRKANGTLDRVKVKRNLSLDGGGLGAWELLLRYSQVDLNDGGIAGGRLNDITGGVSWYLNPNFKITFNYVYAQLDRGVADGDNAHIFETRVQADF